VLCSDAAARLLDVTMILSDGTFESLTITGHRAKRRLDWLTAPSDVFTQLADGKLNGQKAFMTGQLKVKGNVSVIWSLLKKAALTHTQRS
jgi:putative sterol carrier protein